MIDTKLLTIYSDGFRLWRWGFRVQTAWLKGLVIGIHFQPGRRSSWLQAKLVLWLLVVSVTIEHSASFVRIPDRLSDKGRWYLP